MKTRYVAFLRQPDVAALLLVAFFARMPIGMVGFSMLMYLREALGSYALAGSAVGAGFIAMALAAPVQGRLIDLYGPRHVLRVTGVVQPLALLGVLASVRLDDAYAAAVFFSALSGAFASPITTLTRTLWRHRFQREEDRRVAFALDAVTIELNFTLGPAIVAALLAVHGATTAFAVSIAVVVASFAIYVSSRALGYFRQERAAERHLLGPLTDRRLWIVFLATCGVTVCFGLMEVGYPAYATSLGAPALAGVLLALNSLGSALGGALYGGLRFKAPIERQFGYAMALMSVPLFVHAFLQAPIAFAATAFVAGLLIAPTIAAQNVLVSRLAPAKYATEAFTWSSTFIVSGLGAGMALGGVLVETLGLRLNFAIGGAVVAAMGMLALAALAPSAPAADAVRAQD